MAEQLSLDNFTSQAQAVLGTAINSAVEYGHSEVTSTHILLAATTMQTQAFQVIDLCGGNTEEISKMCKKTLSGLKKNPGNPQFANDSVVVLQEAFAASKKLKEKNVSAASLVCGLVADSSMQSAKILARYKIDAETVANALKNDAEDAEEAEIASQGYIERFGVDMTTMAEKGEIDPVIGRDSEIRRLCEILARRSKNNPIIVGPAGVGKALANTTPIPVLRDGDFTFTLIEDIRFDDQVFGVDGKPYPVVGIFPQGKRYLKKIVFDTGRTLTCDLEHLHEVNIQGKKKVLTTKELIDDDLIVKKTEKKPAHYVSVPLNQAIDYTPWGSKEEVSNKLKSLLRNKCYHSVEDDELFITAPAKIDDNDISLMVRSLGVWAKEKDGYLLIPIHEKYVQLLFDYHDSFYQSSLFFLHQIPKLQIPDNDIISHYENAGENEATCITTTAPRGLYLAADFIVTHNTALVEGLALKIAHDDVPRAIKGKRIISIDMPSLTAGTANRGDFEERFTGLVDEIAGLEGKIITFIDEIHTIMGAGGEGASDAANLLKPALARGKLKLVGATTLDEYRQYIEKDPALTRRFQKVQVDQPDRDAAINILRGIKRIYEVHHQVRIQDQALVSAVDLSSRYITDRYLPDKAIDIVDEACSRLSLQLDSSPAEVEQLKRKIRELEIEQASLSREIDGASEARIHEIQNQLSDRKEELSQATLKWDTRRSKLKQIAAKKKEVDELKMKTQELEKQGDFLAVSTIEQEQIPHLVKEIQTLEEEMSGTGATGAGEVTEDVVADVVSDMTGVPVGKMLGDESETLAHLEDLLSDTVKGQDEAISVVSQAVRRSRTGVSDPNKPIGSFLFLGRSGTGKALVDSDEMPVYDTVSGIAWKRVGEIVPGDYVFDDRGRPTIVQASYPQGTRKVWEVETELGVLKCHKNHQFSCFTGNPGALVPLGVQPTTSIRDTKRAGSRVFLPANPPLKPGRKPLGIEDGGLNPHLISFGKKIYSPKSITFTQGAYELSFPKKIDSLQFQHLAHMCGGNIRQETKDIKLRLSQASLREIRYPNISYQENRDYGVIEVLSVKETDDYEPMTCISVNSPDHLFVGPNHIVSHNTLLAKTIGEHLFSSDRSIVRIDMSEFQEKHSVARLVGAPPGYVGYEQGGQLTDQVRTHPYSVVLFDEVEKAHPDVFDILLQVLDEGRLTDGQGRLIDFRNTIIILTSNLGAVDGKEAMVQAAKDHFKPEFLNRLDGMITFNDLDEAQLKAIVTNTVSQVSDRVQRNRGIKLQATDAAIDYLADIGYDPLYGARPIKRAIDSNILNQLSDGLVSGKFGDTNSIVIDYDETEDDVTLEPGELPEKEDDDDDSSLSEFVDDEEPLDSDNEISEANSEALSAALGGIGKTDNPDALKSDSEEYSVDNSGDDFDSVDKNHRDNDVYQEDESQPSSSSSPKPGDGVSDSSISDDKSESSRSDDETIPGFDSKDDEDEARQEILRVLGLD